MGDDGAHGVYIGFLRPHDSVEDLADDTVIGREVHLLDGVVPGHLFLDDSLEQIDEDKVDSFLFN